MTGLEFKTGHLLGRIGNLEFHLRGLKGLNDIFYRLAKKCTEEEDEDAITLVGLTRLEKDLLEDIAETIQELREIADDGLKKDRQAREAIKSGNVTLDKAKE